MFSTKYYLLQSSLFRNNLRYATPKALNSYFQENSRCQRSYNGNSQPWLVNGTKNYAFSSLFIQNRRWYSKKLLDTADYSIDLKKIKSIFPEPRMTLNNLSAKVPEKTFDVYFKQHVLPKGAKKKNPQNLDWTCTYFFVWPEKMKFECTAISKRQASEAAATQALHWLTVNKRIDTRGHPIIGIEELKRVPSSFDEHMQAKLSEKSVERIGKIWEDYESEIKYIYERIHNEAKQKEVHAVPISKESTFDDDVFLDAENDNAVEKVEASGLNGCSHVIIDEAHERDINTDISLLLLKRALSLNLNLKLVVMSATLDSSVFTRYFGTTCPVIEVPGLNYPVEVSYLDEIQKKLKIDLPNTVATCQRDGKPQLNIPEIVDTITAVDKHGKEGAILVFLPGWAEIKIAKQMLDERFKQTGLHVVLPVHSRLSTADQSAMFKPPPPGVRKIVLATNVAETSVTIPDVTHVIDAGACKQNTLRESSDALTPNEHLTRLGRVLSTLQLSPRMGLSLVHAWVLGTAVAVSDLAASADVEVFLNAAERREEIREIKRKFSVTSDYVALWKLQQQFEETSGGSNQELNAWCEQYQVKKERMSFVKCLSNLYLSQLLKAGLVETTLELEDMSRFSGSEQLSVGTILSAVDALLVGKRVVRTKGKIKLEQRLFSTTGGHAHVSSESVNHAACKRPARCLLAHTGGRHSAERRALLVNNTSAVSEHVALLFCRGQLQRNIFDEETTVLSLPKHKLDVNVPNNEADAILKAREMLWKTIQYHIDRDLKTLNYDEHTLISRFKIRLIKAIRRILAEGHKERFPWSSLNVDVDE